MKALVRYYDGTSSMLDVHEADRIEVDHEKNCLLLRFTSNGGLYTGKAIYYGFIAVTVDAATPAA